MKDGFTRYRESVDGEGGRLDERRMKGRGFLLEVQGLALGMGRFLALTVLGYHVGDISCDITIM